MESIIIFIKLLCAHLCSDFILQTDSINNGSANLVLRGLVICYFIAPYMHVWHICWWRIGYAGLYLWSFLPAIL